MKSYIPLNNYIQLSFIETHTHGILGLKKLKEQRYTKSFQLAPAIPLIEVEPPGQSEMGIFVPSASFLSPWMPCVCVAKLNLYKLNTFMFNTDILKCKEVFQFICKHQIISFIGFDCSPYALSFQHFRTLLYLLIDANPARLRIG